MNLKDLQETLKTILVDMDGEIVTLTFHRPEALNALNGEMLQELHQVLQCIAKDDAVRGVILTGDGKKAFIAGADIAEFVPLNAVSGRAFAAFGQEDICDFIENLPKPVIAAVNGYALGGGNEVAMACDIRIASANATFGHPEVGLGIMPLYAGTQRLTRLVGIGRAKELIFTSRLIKAEEAYRIGLVNQVVAQEELLDAAKKMMREILSKAPLSIQMSKIAMNKGQSMNLSDAAELERDLAAILFASEDKIEGVDAFLHKRIAQFKGK